ncbi:hypothetical protein RJ639_034484 [Escallonia herrerae]|uniref:NAC domain-containing protein n=1 Tax=Escallonia herrerae TaxID=1293975 RepID=A0AA89AFZ8_9ASTE|nr:hypothetical protein RJ639_022491 [Escallonia herrerae]KAK3033709.1 hypothetical protein RJ639_034484 [Escallonia herrerae]
MERRSNSDIQLPPGFRFHPSDEELIMHYLKNKATSSPLPASIIAEVELYKFNPWELPSMCCFQIWTSINHIFLDDWVLCRVRQKSSTPRNNCKDLRGLSNEAVGYFPLVDKTSSTPTSPNLEMLGDSLFKDCPMLPFIFGSQLEFPCMDTGSSISFEDSRTSPSVCDDYIYQESLQVSPHPCNSIFNTKKRERVESNPQENSLQSNKKVSKRDQKEEVVCLSNNTTTMNFNSTADQYATNGFNTDQWNFMMQYQELNHMAFT